MFEHGLLWATVLLSWTLLKASLAATLVIYPSYKSYKALESRSPQAAQGMLLYWIMTAFVNSLKEMADQVLGTYSNVFIWKLTVLALKAAPLIIGPERMYTMIIRPLFDANAEQVDAVVDEAHKLRSMAKDAIPAAKAGDVAAVKGKAGEIASEVKDATSELVETAVETLKEKTAVLQEKTEALGVTLNKEGAMAMLAQLMSGVETVRDAGVDAAASTWKTHGPMITEKAGLARNKTSELYQTHAPVVQQKLLSTYQTTVLPRVQPVFNTMSAKYNDSIKPVALAQKEKANALWQQHGGPVRKFYSERALPLYRTKLQPFYQTQLKPWVLHSFLPAVWETLLALKDRLMDLINPPTEEVKSARAGAKLRRREANERRSQWKRRGDKVKDKWAGEWQAMEKEKELSPAASSSSDSTSVAEAALASAATLTNRKTKQSTDSSLERSHVIPPEESQLDPSAPAFEPSAPLKEESLLVKESALPAPVADSAKLQGDKLGNSPDLTKEGANFQGERSGRIVEPIQ